MTREWIISKYAQIRVAARCDAAKCGRAECVGRAGGIGAQAFFHGEILVGAARRAVEANASDCSADTEAWIAAHDRPIASEGKARASAEQIAESEESVHPILAQACGCAACVIRFVERLHAGNAAMHACQFRVVHGLAMFEARDACVIFWSDGIKRDPQRFVTDHMDAWRESMSNDGARPRTESIGMVRCKLHKHAAIVRVIGVRAKHARGAAAERAIDETLPTNDRQEFVMGKGAAPRKVNRPRAIENGGNDAHRACSTRVRS